MNTPRSVKSAAAKEEVSTLRMSPMEVERLKRDLEAMHSGPASAQRTYKRWPFESRSIRVEIQHPGGATTTLNYVPRNISREGIGLLHSSFVYTGTRCTVYLPHPTRGPVPLGGTIMRCRHFRGKVHELGVRFDKAIDVKEFLGLDGNQDCYSLENVPPDSLSGSVLLIDPGEMDRALIRHHLKDTNLTVTAVGTAAEGLERAQEGYDIILCALELPDDDGLEVLSKLRDRGIQTSFMLMCSPAGPASIRERLRVVQPQAVVCKPVPAQSLLSAIAEFLLVAAKDLGGGGAAILSSLSPKDPLAEHIPEYLGQLKQLAERMGAALNSGDVQECMRVVFQVQGSSPTFGYSALTEAAAQAYNTLHASQSMAESAGVVRKLIGMCYRAQTHRKAA